MGNIVFILIFLQSMLACFGGEWIHFSADEPQRKVLSISPSGQYQIMAISKTEREDEEGGTPFGRLELHAGVNSWPIKGRLSSMYNGPLAAVSFYIEWDKYEKWVLIAGHRRWGGEFCVIRLKKKLELDSAIENFQVEAVINDLISKNKLPKRTSFRGGAWYLPKKRIDETLKIDIWGMADPPGSYASDYEVRSLLLLDIKKNGTKIRFKDSKADPG